MKKTKPQLKKSKSLFESVHTACPAVSADPGVRSVLALLAVLPESISRKDLYAILRRLQWSEADLLALPYKIDQLEESKIAVGVELFVELAPRLRRAVQVSTNEDDAALRLEGYRQLTAAARQSVGGVPDIVWRHAAYFAMNAQEPKRLLRFLKTPKNYQRTTVSSTAVIAVPYWCDAIAQLDTESDLTSSQRLRMLKPVLPDVMDELENQFYSMGRLLPIVQSLVALLDKEDDETLFALFDGCAGGLTPFTSISADTRGALGLIQLFGEAGAFDRQMQLAKRAVEMYDDFDVHHFATVAASHWGRHLPAAEGEPLLREAIEGVSNAKALSGATETASYPLRHTILAMSRLGLGEAAEARSELLTAMRHYRQALRHISERRRNAQVLGYKAQILLALGREDDAWSEAKNVIDQTYSSVDGGEILLQTSSSDILHKQFIPYCTLQAVCCSLAHGPFVNDFHRKRIVSKAILPFLIRENMYPMALAFDPEEAEALVPGIKQKCDESHCGEQRVEITVGSTRAVVHAEVWRWIPPGKDTIVVVGLPEFGIYARGQFIEGAARNLGHVVKILAGGRRRSSQRLRPIDVRIQTWYESHLSGETTNAMPLLREASGAYYRGRQNEAWEKLQPIARHHSFLDDHTLREYLRATAWISAEVGEADPMRPLYHLFDYELPSLGTFTDLQKSGAARGLTPHPIVKAVHEVVEARRMTNEEHFFAPIERLYYGLYLLSTGQNAGAERMFIEGLQAEMEGPKQTRLIARISDALAEVLRRRGEHDLARRMLDENIQKREAESISIAPSLLQRAKTAANANDARTDIAKAIELYTQFNRKEVVRALLIQARISSDTEQHATILEEVTTRAKTIPALRDDTNLKNVLNNWEAWCRPSFGPELDYWNL